MMKKPILITMMTITGAMSAQMKYVSGFRKHLQKRSAHHDWTSGGNPDLRSVVAVVWLCW